MHGAVAPVVRVAASELEAKLGLSEFLLGSTDLQVSARRAVDWLVSQTGIRHTVVAFAEPASSQLQIVAEHGVSSAAIVDFVLTREDEAHPLIKALHRKEPSYFDGRQTFRAPFEGRFHAIPLRAIRGAALSAPVPSDELDGSRGDTGSSIGAAPGID